MHIKYSLVIPCFNESSSLPSLISEIENIVSSYDIEFILVNNGSTDNSEKFLREISHRNISVLKLEKNAGYGGGIKAGLAIAKGDYRGWIHADLQYSLKDSLKFLDVLSAEDDFIKGLRKGRSLFQKFISANMSIFESVLFGKLLYDINAQPTIFHKDALIYLSNMPDDFSIDLYTYLILSKHGFRIKRFKVIFLNRSFGKSSWNNGLKSIFIMSLRTIRYSIDLRTKI
jgi:glycosyltransferase involved in cell wall biosynthesis